MNQQISKDPVMFILRGKGSIRGTAAGRATFISPTGRTSMSLVFSSTGRRHASKARTRNSTAETILIVEMFFDNAYTVGRSW